jgi:Ca2+-binding EF-hand superfamily protein
MFLFAALVMPAVAQENQDNPNQERPRRAGRGDQEGRGQGLDAEQVFARMDQNKDGKISKDELGERGERLAQADANKDGDITREELQAAFARLREQAQQAFNPEQLFARIDQNKDGKITKDELNERTQWVLQADENRDNEISKDEFQVAARRLRERTGQAGQFNPEQMFARMDQNGDGKLQKDELRGPLADRFADADADKDEVISKEEFNAVAERIRSQMRLPSVDETFTQYDKNNDGKLTRDELPEQAANFILRADSDNDEAVTKDELRAARERFQNRQGRERNEGEDRPEGERRPAAEPEKD